MKKINKHDFPSYQKILRRMRSLRDEGFTWEQIAAVWQADPLGVGPRLAFRLAHAIGAQRAADRWNTLAVGPPAMTGTRIRDLERPERRPSLAELEMLAHIYQTTARSLLTDDEYAAYPEAIRAEIHRIDYSGLDDNFRPPILDYPAPVGPGDGPPAEELAGFPTRDDIEKDDEISQAAREILAAVDAGEPVPPEAFDKLLSGLERLLAGGRDGVGLDEWEEVAWERALAYYTEGPGSLLNKLLLNYINLSELVKRIRFRPVVPELLRINTRTATMLGMELDDIGNPLAAAMFWQAARRTADCIGDRHLRVWVRAWEAHHGYWSGRPAEVVTRLADEAAYIAGNKVCRALVEAHMVRAFALASEGDADGGRAALRDLERTVDRLADAVRGDPHAPRWILPAWVKSWGAAYSYALIGDTRRASQEVAQARELCPDGAHGATLNLQLVQALTLITDNDIDAGLNLALTATRTWPPDPPRRRIIVQLLTALPPESRAHPAARELHRLILP